MKPSLDEFAKMGTGSEYVPVYREFLADLETPVSVLRRFAEEKHVFLLESVEGGERFGRYSIIGVNPYGIMTVEDGQAYLSAPGKPKEAIGEKGKGFFALRELVKEAKALTYPGLPPLFGGAVGSLDYEVVSEFEKIPLRGKKEDRPEALFMLTREMIIFDTMKHTVMIVVSVRKRDYKDAESAYRYAEERITAIRERMTAPLPPSELEPEVTKSDEIKLESNMTKEDYCEAVERAKELISEGEVIQVVPAQKFSAPAPKNSFQIYRALRLINPSPYLFYIKNGDRILIGSSPETMVKLENGTAAIRPIAGTRPRGADQKEDTLLADELLKDEKERAEHLMLVDLGRNDLGRLAMPGSVQVKSFMQVERYSHVMHLVSNIEAELKPEYDAFDLVASSFPAGTLSGAPKIRAMEIISELEPERRGAYGGAVGYFSSTGNMDLAITIRTLEIKGGTLSFGVGAGVVADSVPENEYKETLNKAGAIMKALRFVSQGLSL